MNARVPHLGVVHGMPNADYHAIEALGASGLKKLARSPRHYFGTTLDPQRPPADETAAMTAGTLAHCAVLEPDQMEARYVVRPPGTDLRTKEGKAWAASVDPSLTIITRDQNDTAWRQARAIRALPEVAALLSEGHAEVSAFWVDEQTGELCKCRPDWVSPAGEGVILLDVKTCQDASPAGFPRTIANFGYHRQAAWYSRGFEKASGLEVLGFVFACVEADYPHAAAAYMLDDASLDKADEENRRLLAAYAACKASGEWPGYPSAIQPLSLPAWAF